MQGAEQNVAKKVCKGCPVRMECLADALDNQVEFGVWGGMTERERRALLRKHPDIVSWRKIFEKALAEEGAPTSRSDTHDDWFISASATERRSSRSCTSAAKAGTRAWGTSGHATVYRMAIRRSVST